MLKKMNAYKRHNGGALVVVIMMMFVVMILGTIILQISVAETKFSVRDKNRIEAYYLAKSAVSATADWLNESGNDPALILNKKSEVEVLPGSTGEYFVEVMDDVANGLLILKGTGTVNGVSDTATMTMQRVVDETTGFGFDYAIYAGEDLTVSGNIHVDPTQPVGYGDTFTKNGNAGEFPVAGGSLEQIVLNYPDPVYPASTTSLGNLVVSGNHTINFSSPIQKTITYNSIILSNGSTLTIETGTGAGEVNLIADSIDFKANNSTMIINGDKRVNLYFKGNVEVRSNINPGTPPAPQKLLFLMTGTGTFNLDNSGGSVFNAFIYAPQATFITSGNNLFTGAVIFKNVQMSGTPFLDSYVYNGGTGGIEIHFESYYVGGSWIE